MAKFTYNEVKEFESIKEMLDIAVADTPNNPAYMYRNPVNGEIVTKTFIEVVAEVNALGTALSNRGIIQGHVAIVGENSYRWIISYLTALKGNGVFVPVDKELTIPEIIHVVGHSDSEALFYSKSFKKSLPDLKVALPKLKYFILLDSDFEENDEYTDDDGVCFINYESLISEGNKQLQAGNESFLTVKNDPTKAKLLIYTSGTTGDPKGVMLSENNIVAMVINGLRVSTIYTRCLSVLPYNHTYEAIAGLLVSYHKHACVCINENKRTVLKNLQAYKPDYIYLVPAYCEAFYKNIQSNIRKKGKTKAFAILIKTSNLLRKMGIDVRRKLFNEIHEAFGGNLIKIVCGGAPIRNEIAEFFDAIGIFLCNGYGITECSPLVAVNSERLNDSRTVGLVLPCLQIRLDDINSDGEGEICVKGDNVMIGYYKNEALTAEVLRDGWFSTGDYGRINELGQLTITGRKKNMIVLKNGKNIYPEELEAVIMEIPFVTEVVVSGIPGEENSETGIAAEVYLNSDELKSMNIPEEDSLKTLREYISKAFAGYPRYKQISKVTTRDTEFPKTTTAKIRRNKLNKS